MLHTYCSIRKRKHAEQSVSTACARRSWRRLRKGTKPDTNRDDRNDFLYTILYVPIPIMHPIAALSVGAGVLVAGTTASALKLAASYAGKDFINGPSILLPSARDLLTAK